MEVQCWLHMRMGIPSSHEPLGTIEPLNPCLCFAVVLQALLDQDPGQKGMMGPGRRRGELHVGEVWPQNSVRQQGPEVSRNMASYFQTTGEDP